MKLNFWVASFGALLAMPISALAQQSPREADPADARVAVPAVAYDSAMARTAGPKSGPELGDATPDKLWVAANGTVSATQGHSGHEVEGSPANAQPTSGPAVQPAPARPSAQPAIEHGKHH